jgi:hypothetical protein
MSSTLLRRWLSSENRFNKRYAPDFPLYKFHRLYGEKERDQLTDAELRTQVSFPSVRESKLYVLDPFFISLLQRHAIWFSPATQFNDPWDAGGAVSILRSNTRIERLVLSLLFSKRESAKVSRLPDQEKYPRIEAVLREEFGLLRFACFTKRYDSNPMWAHYADNHRGVCLWFEFAHFKAGGFVGAVDTPFNGHYPVRYRTDFAQIRNINTIDSAIEVLFTKHPDWAYEQEVRFIKLADPNFPGEGGTIAFDKSSLKAVILGCKVPLTFGRVVRRLLNLFGYERTELWRTHFDASRQALTHQKYVPRAAGARAPMPPTGDKEPSAQ